MTSYALSYGFSNDLAFYLISMLNAASMLGRIVTGIMADRLGAFNVITISIMLSGIFFLGMWIVATSHAAIMSVTILIGFFSGGYISVFIACVAKISPMEKFGSRLTDW
jgi:MFS family permease